MQIIRHVRSLGVAPQARLLLLLLLRILERVWNNCDLPDLL